MWHGGSPEQRLWLGANRYRNSCRNPGTDPKCLAYSCVNRYPLRGYDSDSDANCNSNGYRYPNCDCYSYSYSYGNAQTDAYAENCANTETSSYSPAETVVVFAKAEIIAISDRQ